MAVDHLTYDLIYRHLLGQTSEEEEHNLFVWIEEREENRNFYFEIAAIWKTHRTLSSDKLQQHCEAMICRLNARIDADAEMQKTVRTRNIRRWMRSAVAVAAMIAIVTALWIVPFEVNNQDRFISYVNMTQEVMSLKLDDGSQVWMQRQTKLEYAYHPKTGERIVRLDGEAYFNVSRDTLHPFVVQTGALFVRVLGTEFNVRAFSSDPQTEVTLESGSVRLQTPEGANLLRLHPNQRAVFNAGIDDIEVSEIDASNFVLEHYDLLSMKHATINEIITHIEQVYGFRLRVANPNSTKRYDINLLRSSSPDEVVDLIRALTGEPCEVISK